MVDQVKIIVWDKTEKQREIFATSGAPLRDIIIKNNLSPYNGGFKNFNCGGLGICGTCKVWVLENGEFWERRSCQIQCFQEMEIRLK